MQEIVTPNNLATVVEYLRRQKFLGLDTETTGLSSFHGDRLFSISMASGERSYYFNFQQYPPNQASPDFILDRATTLQALGDIFDDDTKTWFIHNAKFDLHMLRADGVSIRGRVACTYVGARLCNNLLQKLGLAEIAEDIGEKKDDKVMEWIKANKAYRSSYSQLTTRKQPDFTKVPFHLISAYACKDAELTYALGKKQFETIAKWDQEPKRPKASQPLETEAKLTKVLLDMEAIGTQVDVSFCRYALQSRQQIMEEARKEFCTITGQDYKASGKIFEKVFEDEKDKWAYTEKGNPSFVAKVLRTFDSASAGCVLRYKDAKAEADFFGNFLSLADERGVIHTSFNPGRARTGRFSSSQPNLQNLKRPDKDTKTSEEGDTYKVRGAFVPRPGFIFVAIDYEQIEYRVMLDQAQARGLIAKVIGGLDVHEATAQVAHVTRQQAKTVNFLTLYGGGIKKLAGDLKVTEAEARKIQNSIFDAAPEIRDWIRQTIETAKHSYVASIFNWYGRRYLYPASEKDFAYRAPNYVIQGGCADVMKIAMVRVSEFLQGRASRMILTIHDELVFEVAHGEEWVISPIAEIMRKSYPHTLLPLDVDIEYSLHNLAEKKPWSGFLSDPEVTWECANEEARDEVQGAHSPQAPQDS